MDMTERIKNQELVGRDRPIDIKPVKMRKAIAIEAEVSIALE